MREDFLHYVWRLQQYDPLRLQTTQAEKLEILDPGFHNHHDGPDFSQAKIRIGSQMWAGNIEIHVKASEWYDHQHEQDRAYDNVILHVVQTEDRPVYRPDGSRLACLELSGRIPARLHRVYQKLLHDPHWIPCQLHLHHANSMVRQMWLDRLLVERLEKRVAGLRQKLEENQMNWEETFFQWLSRALGMKVNSDAFAQLAKSIPFRTLLKHKNSLLQVEALLFGQAGMLNKDWQDDYPRKLQREYKMLSHKYQLQAIAGQQWKFMRLRPANFPTIRIAQLASLIYRTGHLFSKMLVATQLKEMRNMFQVELSHYWRNHYVFDKETAPRPKSLGQQAVDSILINSIIPFLFFYGRHRHEDRYQDRALAILEALPTEKNSIITQWELLGLPAHSAYQSQALLQLKNEYCNQRRCTACQIGHAILSRSGDL